MTRVSTAIQAHPSRRRLAEWLAGEAAADGVAYDPEPDSPTRDPWRSYREALRMSAPARSTHRLVMQDDALPCPGFRRAVDRVARALPEMVVCLFVSGVHPDLAPRIRSTTGTLVVAELRTFLPVVATLYPIAAALDLADHGDAILDAMGSGRWLSRNLLPVARPVLADDELAGRWARERRALVAATAPCLVEHDCAEPSIAGNDWQPHRMAACALPDGVDAARIVWA